MGLVRFGNAGPNFVDKVAMPDMWREAHSSTAGRSRVPQIPEEGATDGLQIQPTGPSQQMAAEGKTRIKAPEQIVKSARELHDAELEATTRAAFLRAQGPNNEARPVGVSMDSALAGLGWVKASLVRDHPALATAHRTRLLPPKPCLAKPHKGPRWPALQRPRSR